MKHTFTAGDGTEFETLAECKEHEAMASLIDPLVRLDHPHIAAALDRTDITLADAFERVGNIIAHKRRQSGELKRSPKNDRKHEEESKKP